MTSILFVHGAGHAAWCWEDHFTDWFEARGYTVAAPDLPHHGHLDRRGVMSTPLRKYLDAVGRAAAGLEPPLVIVGHSLGGFVVQKYLEQADADLAVLLAPSPLGFPGSPLLFGWRVASRHPVLFLKILATGRVTDRPEVTREFFFTPETPSEIVERCYSRMQPESIRFLLDAMPPLHPERVRTPVVVVGARGDPMVPVPKDIATTGRMYHTTPRIVPGGHNMMLDTAWEQVAGTIETAIVERLASDAADRAGDLAAIPQA
jgi:pimeloyl-ACP methyl ester carboxylesterase